MIRIIERTGTAMRGLIKSLVQESLRRHDLRLTHNREDHWLPDFDMLGVLVAWRFAKRPPRLAVQVGANDGQTGDPMHPLIQYYELRAVVIEPLPEPYEKLVAAYARNELVRTIQAAIDRTSGHRDIWRVQCNVTTESDFSSVSSFDRKVVEKHHRQYAPFGGVLTRSRVETLCVSDLLRGCELNEPIDILQVDTEGYDAVIVSEFLRAGCRPTIINYEHIHLSGQADAQCRTLLRDHGYRLVRYGRDTAAILPETDTEHAASECITQADGERAAAPAHM